MGKMKKIFTCLGLILFFTAPSWANGQAWLAHWEKIPEENLPTMIPDGDLAKFRLALTRQIENCEGQKTGKFKSCGMEKKILPVECDRDFLRKINTLAKASKSWKSFYQALRPTADWYRYRAEPNQVLFTGYNSPLFVGALKKDSKYLYPVYSLPSDLVQLQDEKGEMRWRREMPDGGSGPYFDRRAIEKENVLEKRAQAVAYLEFPTDVLRLQIEGSGILRVKDKGGKFKEYGLNYAGQNGFPYLSIFKVMKEHKVDAKYMSFPGLQKFFQEKPDDFWKAHLASQSYVFFHLTNEPPCGAAKVHITGGHSLAVDPTQFPLGQVGFVEASRPVEGSDPAGKDTPTKKFTRFAVAQDIGGAIKGAHVDIYWGEDAYAQLASNTMSTRGNLYLLRAKSKK